MVVTRDEGRGCYCADVNDFNFGYVILDSAMVESCVARPDGPVPAASRAEPVYETYSVVNLDTGVTFERQAASPEEALYNIALLCGSMPDNTRNRQTLRNLINYTRGVRVAGHFVQHAYIDIPNGQTVSVRVTL
jgi:hypothetical protein